MSLSNGWQRLARWWRRYVRITDLLRLGMLASAGVLAVNSYSFSPRVSAVAGIAYFLLFVPVAVQTFREREANDRVQAEVVWGLFCQMNRELFNDDHRTRFTLFCASPLRPSLIVPWYRYSKGAVDPIAEAETSSAQYRRNEGLTGAAWTRSGKLLWSQLGPFSTRAEFEHAYIDQFKIDPAVVRKLSDFMVDVQSMFTCGFEDGHGRFLGVLSLDLQFPRPDNLDSEALRIVVGSIGNVLESFASIDRRNNA